MTRINDVADHLVGLRVIADLALQLVQELHSPAGCGGDFTIGEREGNSLAWCVGELLERIEALTDLVRGDAPVVVKIGRARQ